MTRFRWRCGPRKGNWHPTRLEAKASAIRAGLASRDEHVKNRVYLDELVWIEEG